MLAHASINLSVLGETDLVLSKPLTGASIHHESDAKQIMLARLRLDPNSGTIVQLNNEWASQWVRRLESPK